MAVGLAGLWTGAQGQTTVFRVGAGGVSWQDEAGSQIGVAGTSAGLHPIQVFPDSNLTQTLQRERGAFLVGAPREYVVGGVARVWVIGSGYYNGLAATAGPLGLVDGQDTSSTGTVFKTMQDQSGATILLDLGAAYPVNRIRFYPRPADQDAFMRAFEIYTSDGRQFDDNDLPVWNLFDRQERNTGAVVDITRQTQPVRTIRLRHTASSRFNVAEVEIYGDGFIPNSSYVSQLHQFTAPVNFGQLRVRARRLAGRTTQTGIPSAMASVQVRSGADDTPDVYYRRDRNTGIQEVVTLGDWESLRRGSQTVCFRRNPSTGEIMEELSRGQWLQLPVEEQASPCRDYIAGDKRLDTANWSTWSEPLLVDSTGAFAAALDLPSPRSYVQFKVAFANDAGAAMELQSLEMEISPLLADRSVGELSLQSDLAPEGGLVTAPPGVDTSFVCAVLADFGGRQLPGFRGLRVESFPAPVFSALSMGDPLQPKVAPQVQTTANGFDVFFDPVGPSHNEPLQVAFRQALVEHTTPVRVWLLPSGSGLPQPVEAGDASSAIRTSTLSVLANRVRPSVALELSTPVVSPNGDGRNDRVVPTLTLGQFSGPLDVTLKVLDLSGRLVRTLYSGMVTPGRFVGAYNGVDLGWAGRDDHGDIVPPGTYLMRLEVVAASRTFTRVGVIGVAY